MNARKYKNLKLNRGVLLDRGYVFVRQFHNGRPLARKCVGRISERNVILANMLVNKRNEKRHLGKLGYDAELDSMTIERACDLFWELHASRLRSAYSYKFFLKGIKRFFAGRLVQDMTYLDIQNYRQERSRQVKANTVNREHGVITTLFHKLSEWKRMGRPELKDVKLPGENPGSLVPKVNEKPFRRKRVLTPEEYARLMEHADEPLRRAINAALHTYLRRKDLLQFDTSKNVSGDAIIGIQSKTGKEYSNPLSPELRNLIETTDGNRLLNMSERTLERKFKLAVAQAGIKNLQFRDLRRSSATMALNHGASLSTVSSYLGHASLRMTEDYVGALEEEKKKAASIIGQVYNTAARCRTVVKTVVRHFKNTSANYTKQIELTI